MRRLLFLFAIVAQSTIGIKAQKVELGLTGGTTGFGVELGVKPLDELKVRVGFSYFPKVNLINSYGMTSISDIHTDENQEDRINRLCKRLGEFINSDRIDPLIDMEHRLNFWNAKILFDVYPFKKKNWHFTVGTYIGPKKMGNVINLQSEAPTTMAVRIYNDVYDKLKNDYNEYHALYPDDPYYIPSVTLMGMSFSPLPEQWEEIQKMGRVVVPMGKFANGTPYYLEPDADGVIHATLRSHIVKPYLGVGYDFSFGADKRWNFGVDAGALILGKTPHLYDNQGVCLTHDVQDIGGGVGRLIHMVQKLPVYPNVEVRLSYTIH